MLLHESNQTARSHSRSIPPICRSVPQKSTSRHGNLRALGQWPYLLAYLLALGRCTAAYLTLVFGPIWKKSTRPVPLLVYEGRREFSA